MSWIEIDLTGVSTEMENLPEGPQVFSLLSGAKYSQFDAQKIEVGAKVVEGEYAGRVQYFSYGNPEKAPSMIGAFKRLELALVADGAPAIEANENPVQYLNSSEVVGKKFIAPVRHRTYVKPGETDPTLKVDINVFKVKGIA